MQSVQPHSWDRVVAHLPADWHLCCGGGRPFFHIITWHCDTMTSGVFRTSSTSRLAKRLANTTVLVCGVSIHVWTKLIPGPEVDARHCRRPCTIFSQFAASRRLRGVLKKTSPCHLTHPLLAFLPSSRTDQMYICMRKRLSAALHHSTLPGDEQSVEADRL